MKKVVFLTVFIVLSCMTVFATHNRAGEITYRQISAYTFQVTLVTYTYTPSYANESRDVLPIDWGDGTISNIPRISEELLPDNYTKNTYKMNHTFPGPGSYVMVMEDPNRNEGVVNIFESVNIPFSISTTLRIDAILGSNNTPVLLNPPVDKAALGQRFVHNPAAYDPDGDSLSYKLTVCTGQNGEPIPNYTYPATSNEFYVDSISGDLVWDAPVALGIYNVAMLVEEWRMGVKIGQVERDIQIQVYETDNHTPIFEQLQNVCVRAGDTIRFLVKANDVDNDYMTLTANGGPLELTTNRAIFEAHANNGSVQSEFIWVPGCTEVREQPYTVVFKATDFGASISLAALQYVSISVIGQPPVSIQLQSQSTSIGLSWHDSICSNNVSYDVFRSRRSNAYTPQYCETGLPQILSPDYRFVERIDSSLNLYVDNNHGNGLSPGFTYCYRMLSNYVDSFPSYISDEVCIELIPIFPVITNVSIQNTDIQNGEVYVAWSQPHVDTIAFPHPYSYRLYRSFGYNGANREFVTEIFNLEDTSFLDTGLNTVSTPISYVIELYSQASGSAVLLGSSPVNSSPFITLFPENKKITIHVTAQVGWENDSMYVYRKQIDTDTFDSIGVFVNGSYIDEGLINLQEFCYYVKTSGYFDSDVLPMRVYNFSQIACMVPIDTIPPKSPSFTVIQDCDSLIRQIKWNKNANDEIKTVNIYFKECRVGSYVTIASISSIDTMYTHRFEDTVTNIAGCYYVTFIDSAGNESKLDIDTCMYNCPIYILPNIFTPNADGQNDVYHPYKNRFVEKVDMKIYDSWGQLVFETANPKINWNGYNMVTKKPCDDGVFYYVCDVYEYWSDCEIHPRTLVGFIHKFSDGKNSELRNE